MYYAGGLCTGPARRPGTVNVHTPPTTVASCHEVDADRGVLVAIAAR